jgi:hypothetical protein
MTHFKAVYRHGPVDNDILGTVNIVAIPVKVQTGYLSIQQDSDIPETAYFVTPLQRYVSTKY